MIDVAVLPLFFSAVVFLVISPGPDLVLISSYSSMGGFKAGAMIALGIFIAGVVQTLLVAFGLGQLIQTLPLLAYAIKVVGALYLSWIGLKMLKTWYQRLNQEMPATSLDAGCQTQEGNQTGALNLVIKGLLNNLLNPKALLFFSLFLPQFTKGTTQLSDQILILGMLLSAFALLANLSFAFFFSMLAKWMVSTKQSCIRRAEGKKSIFSRLDFGRHIEGVLGLIFIGLAARLTADR